tara:strand:+ start:862 stop:2211 length:1350 start_codon:yes stop_codon:yes gene_type:complete
MKLKNNRITSEYFLNNSVKSISEDLNNRKIKPEDLLEISSYKHSKYNPRFHFCESFRLPIINHNYNKTNLLNSIPFLAKDIYNTRDFLTEMGSNIWKGFSPGNNARIIDSLLDENAFLLGKTVTSEFAIHAKNKTLNPFNTNRKVGTSSSGSAVAVSVGTVPFALATQTAGSISRPSSFCGVFGLKPTYSLLPRTGILKTTDTLDNPGFITSHFDSLKPILDVIRVKGRNHPYVYKHIDNLNEKHTKTFRIGFIKTSCWEYASDFIKDNIIDLVEEISKNINYKIDEIPNQIILDDAHSVHDIIYNKCISKYFFDEYKKSKVTISESTLSMINKGINIEVNQYLKALDIQANLTSEITNLFSGYDAILSLATSSSAPLLNEEELPDPSLIWTLAGVPSVVVPYKLDSKGMPFGIQFVARKYSDYQLLNTLKQLILDNLIPSKSISPFNN